MTSYSVDPDITVASTLPGSFYADEAIVQAVQRGVLSRLYTRGRYSPTRERGVHHFHRLLCEHFT